MKHQRLATVCCIILSLTFSLSLGLFIHFKEFLPMVSDVYQKLLYYPEILYEEYQSEAERIIAKRDFSSCRYPLQITICPEDGTLVLKIGEYNEGKGYSNYITATVKNFKKNEEITFERSRKSARDAYESAMRYKDSANISTTIFIFILTIFTVYLIRNSVKRHYCKVLISILIIIVLIAICSLMKSLLIV